MAEQTQADQQYQEDYFTNLNVRLRDLEEKQTLIKDRLLLIGENLISEKEDTESQLISLKQRMSLIEDELKKIKLGVQRLGEIQEDSARRSDINILKRQFEMFQPLNLARIEDVEQMISKALKERNKKQV